MPYGDFEVQHSEGGVQLRLALGNRRSKAFRRCLACIAIAVGLWALVWSAGLLGPWWILFTTLIMLFPAMGILALLYAWRYPFSIWIDRDGIRIESREGTESLEFAKPVRYVDGGFPFVFPFCHIENGRGAQVSVPLIHSFELEALAAPYQDKTTKDA